MGYEYNVERAKEILEHPRHRVEITTPSGETVAFISLEGAAKVLGLSDSGVGRWRDEGTLQDGKIVKLETVKLLSAVAIEEDYFAEYAANVGGPGRRPTE